jgi:hypothetical protein
LLSLRPPIPYPPFPLLLLCCKYKWTTTVKCVTQEDAYIQFETDANIIDLASAERWMTYLPCIRWARPTAPNTVKEMSGRPYRTNGCFRPHRLNCEACWAILAAGSSGSTFWVAFITESDLCNATAMKLKVELWS